MVVKLAIVIVIRFYSDYIKGVYSVCVLHLGASGNEGLISKDVFRLSPFPQPEKVKKINHRKLSWIQSATPYPHLFYDR